VVPTNIAFDWFQMPVLALVYVVDPLHLWFGSSACRCCSSSCPGCRPSAWARPRPKPRHLPPRPCKAVAIRFDETLLDAGLRQDINLPYECRNGGCGNCKCTVLSGKVDPGLYQPSALSAEELAAGQGAAVLRHRAGRRRNRIRGGGRAKRIRNTPPAWSDGKAHPRRDARHAQAAGRPADPFKAGQYINIILDDGQRRAFSFANPPHQPDLIELQIRLMPGGRFTTHVFER
jgi:CDP-4-dehydro-6-deoxyglucose reductase